MSQTDAGIYITLAGMPIWYLIILSAEKLIWKSRWQEVRKGIRLTLVAMCVANGLLAGAWWAIRHLTIK